MRISVSSFVNNVTSKSVRIENVIRNRALRISWKDRVSYEEVLERVGINMHLFRSIAKRKWHSLDIFVEGQVGMIE